MGPESMPHLLYTRSVLSSCTTNRILLILPRWRYVMSSLHAQSPIVHCRSKKYVFQQGTRVDKPWITLAIDSAESVKRCLIDGFLYISTSTVVLWERHFGTASWQIGNAFFLEVKALLTVSCRMLLEVQPTKPLGGPLPAAHLLLSVGLTRLIFVSDSGLSVSRSSMVSACISGVQYSKMWNGK